MTKHLLFAGRRNVGKTTMTERLMQELTVPVYGYQTKIMEKAPDGAHRIYMYPAGRIDGRMSEENHIGDGNTRERTVNLEVFEKLGAELLEAAQPDGVIVMDEIGYMEIGAERFCRDVLNAFDGDIPVLATIKETERGAEYMDRIRKHPKVKLYNLTRDRFDAIYTEVLPTVKSWNHRSVQT